MSIFIRQLNPGACKSYLLGNEGLSQVILVDPGGRAFTAAQILTKEKFPKVYVLEGGMQEWRKNNPSSLSNA